MHRLDLVISALTALSVKAAQASLLEEPAVPHRLRALRQAKTLFHGLNTVRGGVLTSASPDVKDPLNAATLAPTTTVADGRATTATC